MHPIVQRNRCTMCGTCVYACGKKILKISLKDKAVVPVKPKECVGCYVCVDLCPKKAIKISIPALLKREVKV